MIKNIAQTILPLIIMMSIIATVFALNVMRYGGNF